MSTKQTITPASINQTNIDYVDKLSNCIGDKKLLIDTGYMISHIIIASIFVTCLKRKNPLLLLLLLSLILSYMSYESQNERPLFVLILFGSMIYIIDMFIMNQDYPNDNDIDSNNKKTWINQLWKIPYYGILSHYIMLSGSYFNTKK
jgi:Na+/serine symporter